MAEERPAPTASDRWKPPPAAAEQLATGPASERRPCEIQIWSGAGAMALTAGSCFARVRPRSRCATAHTVRLVVVMSLGAVLPVHRGRARRLCHARQRSPSGAQPECCL